VHVAVDLTGGREHDGQVHAARKLKDVEGHDRVLEGAMGLPDELMHLRVCREVNDEVDLRVLDAVDPATECRVVPGEVLEQRRKRISEPRVRPLVDAEDLMAVALEVQREVGADLAGRAGDEDAHPEQPN